MKNTTQKGSMTIILIILIVIAAIGGIYYATKQKQEITVNATSTTAAVEITETATVAADDFKPVDNEVVAQTPVTSTAAPTAQPSVQTSIVAVSPTIAPAKNTTVSSSKGRFSAALPTGWKLSEDKTLAYPNISVNIIPPANLYTKDDMVLSVNLIPRKYNEDSYEKGTGSVPTTDEMTQGFIKNQGDSDENFQFVNLEKGTFSGKAAYIVNFKYGGDYAIGRYILVYTSDTIFTISKMVATEKSAELNKAINPILSSMVLK